MFRMAHLNYLTPNGNEQGPTWPWYSSTYLNSATLPPETPLGAYWETAGNIKSAGGNAFMMVRAMEGLSQGQLVSFAAGILGEVAGAVASASSTTVLIATNITTIATDPTNHILLSIHNTTSSGGGTVLRPARLVSNGAGTAAYGTNSTFEIETIDYTIATKPYGPNALTLAATNGDACIMTRLYAVGVNTATTVPCGVALQTVTSGYYTVIQVIGEALVLTGGTTPGLVYNELAIPGAAGVITGSTSGATPYMGGGSIISRRTYNTSASILHPVKLNLFGNL